MSKTLVTGAAGFIGSHVTRMLVEQGREVRVMNAPGYPTDNLKELDVELVEGDLLDASSLARALEGVDVLYHLAAIYAVWLPQPAKMFEVNVAGTRNLMELALKAGVERVVHTSSIAAIGIAPGKALSDETTPFNGWDIRNDYVWSKYISELEVLNFVRRGLPAVIVNPVLPFGANDIGPTPTGEIVLNMLRGRLPRVPEAGFNAVDVEDLAALHLLAEEKGRIGERYIGGNAQNNLTFLEFCAAVARVAGISAPTKTIPASMMSFTGSAMEFVANRITHKPPMLAAQAVRYASQYLYFDPTKAIEGLGMPQTPLERTIEKSVEYMQRYHLKR